MFFDNPGRTRNFRKISYSKYVSAQAWNDWMNFQTILINENRLNLMDEKAREFLAEKRNKYFFERRTGST